MKPKFTIPLILLSLMVFTLKAHAVEKKLLVMGDSWARFMCLEHVFEKNIDDMNLAVNVSKSCLSTAKFGHKASAWMGTEYQKVSDQILEKERPDFIYVSLGGNDLGVWNTGFTTEQTDALYQSVIENLKTIVAHIQEKAPKAKILVSGYDYFRLTADNRIKANRELFEKMGQPTPSQLHKMFMDFSNKLSAQIRNENHVYYIQHYGVLNYHYGISDKKIPAFSSLPPQQISTPENPDRMGGFPDELQDKNAMLSLLVYWSDAYHPSKEGFEKISLHAIQNFLMPWISAGE